MTAKTNAIEGFYYRLLSLDLLENGYDIRNYNIRTFQKSVEFEFTVGKGIYTEAIEEICNDVENEEEYEKCFNDVLEEFTRENIIEVEAKIEVKTSTAEIEIKIEPDSLDYGSIYFAGAYIKIAISYDNEEEVNWDIIFSEIVSILNSVLKL